MTNFYMAGDNLEILCEGACGELDRTEDWLQANILSLNIERNFFMFHTHFNCTLIPVSLRFEINGYQMFAPLCFWVLLSMIN